MSDFTLVSDLDHYVIFGFVAINGVKAADHQDAWGQFSVYRKHDGQVVLKLRDENRQTDAEITFDASDAAQLAADLLAATAQS